MQPLFFSTLYCASRVNLINSTVPIYTQLRWKKIPLRKPKWLPMAASKVFRIPQHPVVPHDDSQLKDNLLEEYYRKCESLRKLFQEEIKQNPNIEHDTIELQSEKNEFRQLLEENNRENERIRPFREKIFQKEFEERQWELLHLEEECKKEVEKSKLRVEEIVRMEKEKSALYITKDNLDAAIELAMDSPINIGFSLGLSGSVQWEGKPSLEYEADIQRRISKAIPPT